MTNVQDKTGSASYNDFVAGTGCEPLVHTSKTQPARTAKKKVVAWSDGASRGNPGRGGWGAVLIYTDSQGQEHTLELSAGYLKTTNNRMELMGAIAALEALKVPCEVEFYSDSQYVVKAFTDGWIWGWQKRGWKTASKQPVKNPDLWKRLIAAAAPHTIAWNWVKGHAGTALNERCDELACAAADANRENLLIDVGFEGTRSSEEGYS